MPHWWHAFVDCVTYDVHRRFARRARVYAAHGEGFELQVDAVETEPGRRLFMSGAILNLSTMPDLVPIGTYPYPTRQKARVIASE